MKDALYIVLCVAVFFFLTFILTRAREWLKRNISEIEKRNADDAMKVKAIKLMIPTLFVASIVCAVFGVGTLIIPVLTVLFGVLMEKLQVFLNRYGGLLIICACAVIWWRGKHPKTPPVFEASMFAPSDAVVMKNAREGLYNLLDNISTVCASLAEQTEIYSPGTKGELAYPDITRCIRIEDGVAVVMVRLNYAGDTPPDRMRFLEHFNDRMLQKLNCGELLGHPPAVYIDINNTPHTAIQAIRCVPVKNERFIRLEVVRVNQAALALIDKVSRENQPVENGRGQLFDE